MSDTNRRGPMILVDVPEPYRSSLSEAGARFGVTSLAARHDALAETRGMLPTLLVCGVAEAGQSVCERVRTIRKAFKGVPTVVLADRIDTDGVVRLLRMKVEDVIGIPAPAGDVTGRTLAYLSSEGIQAGGANGKSNLIGQTPIIQHLNQEIDAVARCLSTVLLTGETGTGKGLAARCIHERSSLSNGPFVMINCASLSPSLIESELFGHERGAFTGATSQRRGRFELAEGGTIFLDEIGELDLTLQAKLLRVLQDREYERLGGAQTRAMRARVIAATNRDLRHEVQTGGFRSDLYFRLEVFHLRLPALRERLDDIPILAQSIIADLGTRLGIEPPQLSDDFLDELTRRKWPGNVRELANVLERLSVRACGNMVFPADLSDSLKFDDMVIDSVCARVNCEGRTTVSNVEAPGTEHDSTTDVDGSNDDTQDVFARGDCDYKKHLIIVLRATGGNVARAARRLNIPRSTLRYRIRRYQLGHLTPHD